jgi:hypothetical protein
MFEGRRTAEQAEERSGKLFFFTLLTSLNIAARLDVPFQYGREGKINV